MADRLREGMAAVIEVAARQAKHLRRRCEDRALVDNEVLQLQKVNQVLVEHAKLRLAENDGRTDDLSMMTDDQLRELALTYLERRN